MKLDQIYFQKKISIAFVAYPHLQILNPSHFIQYLVTLAALFLLFQVLLISTRPDQKDRPGQTTQHTWPQGNLAIFVLFMPMDYYWTLQFVFHNMSLSLPEHTLVARTQFYHEIVRHVCIQFASISVNSIPNLRHVVL